MFICPHSSCLYLSDSMVLHEHLSTIERENDYFPNMHYEIWIWFYMKDCILIYLSKLYFNFFLKDNNILCTYMWDTHVYTQDPKIISQNSVHNENRPCEELFMIYVINKELNETRHVFLGLWSSFLLLDIQGE